MAAEEKKICFGFSKLKASSKVLKPAVPCVPKSQENAKQFIDCLENQAIKVKNEVIQEKRELVIPLKPSITSLASNKDKKKPQIDTSNIKTELSSSKGDDANINTSTTNPPVKIKEEIIDNTLDAQARQEILESLSRGDSETEQKVFLLPLTVNVGKQVSTESSLNEIDYESIPIEQFGMALIRGMGWKPDDSKNENKPMDVIQRPKGLGLGADKSTAQVSKSTLNPEDSQLTKNCCVKITGGMHVNKYGKLESFNEDSGRVVVKLALGNEHVTVIENLLVRITQNDYDKNSRVINMQKYEKFKEQDSQSNREEINAKRKCRNSNQEYNKSKIIKDNSKKSEFYSEEERQEKNRRNYDGSNNQNCTAQREESSRSRRETKNRRSLSSDDSNEIRFRQKYNTPQSTSHKENSSIDERSIKSESSRQSKKYSRRESSASSMEEDRKYKKSYRMKHQDADYRGKEKRENKKQQDHSWSSDPQSSESSEDNRRESKSKKHIYSSESESTDSSQDKKRKKKSKKLLSENEKRKRRKKSKRNTLSSETEAERKKKNKKRDKKAKHSY